MDPCGPGYALPAPLGQSTNSMAFNMQGKGLQHFLLKLSVAQWSTAQQNEPTPIDMSEIPPGRLPTTLIKVEESDCYKHWALHSSQVVGDLLCVRYNVLLTGSSLSMPTTLARNRPGRQEAFQTLTFRLAEQTQQQI